MPDHVHILIGLKPAMALADLVREINEYLTLLRKFDIAFDDKYVFEFIE